MNKICQIPNPNPNPNIALKTALEYNIHSTVVYFDIVYVSL